MAEQGRSRTIKVEKSELLCKVNSLLVICLHLSFLANSPRAPPSPSPVGLRVLR